MKCVCACVTVTDRNREKKGLKMKIKLNVFSNNNIDFILLIRWDVKSIVTLNCVGCSMVLS